MGMLRHPVLRADFLGAIGHPSHITSYFFECGRATIHESKNLLRIYFIDIMIFFNSSDFFFLSNPSVLSFFNMICIVMRINLKSRKME